MLLPGSMHRGRGPGLRSEGAANTGLHIHGGVNAHHRAGDAAVFLGPLTPLTAGSLHSAVGSRSVDTILTWRGGMR